MTSFDNEINNAFWYDKTEYYAECGLEKGKKKDGKSRSLKEREKSDQRNKKVAELVSTLPNKMQKKLLDKALFVEPGKPKKITNSVNVSRQNTSEDVAFNEDDEQDDPQEEDAPEDKDDATRDYEMGLAMWLKYGLTKERYDADLEHRANIAALDAFYADPENYLAPEYGEILEEKIRKFEQDSIEREKAADENDDYYPDLDNDLDDEEEDEDLCFEEEDEADMAERYRLDRMESAIENARDDMRDDY
jgi:hypothetical protein